MEDVENVNPTALLSIVNEIPSGRKASDAGSDIFT
jgi:hypothetical protein